MTSTHVPYTMHDYLAACDARVILDAARGTLYTICTLQRGQLRFPLDTREWAYYALLTSAAERNHNLCCFIASRLPDGEAR